MTSPILHAYEMSNKGSATRLDADALVKKSSKDSFIWVHLDGTHPQVENALEQLSLPMDALSTASLLASETRPRMSLQDESIMLILRGMNLNEDAKPEDMVSIRIWANKHYVITVRLRPIKAVMDIAARIDSGHVPSSSADLLCQIISQLFTRMEPTLTDLAEAIDNIEEHILEAADASLRGDIIDIRRQAIIFRRYMAPQRDAISQLCMTQLPWLTSQHQRHLHESLNQITRYVEDLDAVRERAQIIRDELANMLSDRLNKNMYVLSVIAAIFLPLGFLTGLLGVNIAGIPGTDDPNAFFLFSTGLLFLVALQAALFKWMKWF